MAICRRGCTYSLPMENAIPVFQASFLGQFDLMPLCLSRARFFVGNDSGPLHMAVMMGTPTYSFFGSSDVRRTGPFFPGGTEHLTVTDPVPCAPCGDFKTKCSHLSCLVGVTPDVVFPRS
ncbi:MAG: glycosyltransferase family 9 protein [Leptospirillum sp.]